MMQRERFQRHERVAIAISGGKDSLACVHLLRDCWDRCTAYHVDTGDTLPEMRASVDAIKRLMPRFVRVQTDVTGWIATNGLPADLVPYTSHPISRAMGNGRIRLAARFDCCYANRVGPLTARIKADGCTMLVSGVRADDMPSMPFHDGDVVDGLEICCPVETWSAEDVLAYLTVCGADVPPVYEHLEHAPDCARCCAWWSEHRGEWLRRFHPEIWRDYRDRLALIAHELNPALIELRHELVRN